MRFLLLFKCLFFLACLSCTNVPVKKMNTGLNWGNLENSKEVKNVLKHTEDKLLLAPAVKKLYSEGLVFNDPRRLETDNAVKDLPQVFYWAVCGKIKNEAKCIERTRENVLSWVRNYKPEGNPINEQRLLPLFLSYDLGQSFFSDEEKNEIKKWLLGFVLQGEKRFLFKKEAETYKNNHHTWNLSIRAIGAKIVGDNERLENLQKEIEDHAKVNLLDDGETRDFKIRDALHYHVYNMEAYLWIKMFTPELISKDVNKKIENCLQFLKPYFLGTKEHIEFLGSEVPFDKVRKDAGDASFQNKAWEPEQGRKLLKMASSLYPSIEAWANTSRDEQFSPYIKLLSSLHK